MRCASLRDPARIGCSYVCERADRCEWGRAVARSQSVRNASETSSRRIPPVALLLIRCSIFLWCFGLLVWSSFEDGTQSFKFFTV